MRQNYFEFCKSSQIPRIDHHSRYFPLFNSESWLKSREKYEEKSMKSSPASAMGGPLYRFIVASLVKK